MKIPDYAVTALKKLNTAGYDAYFVGGCVRDSLRGVTPVDWDITTSALPEETEKALSDYRVIGTGIKHGTVTAIIGGHPLEITTYRIDGEYSDSRRPDSVIFTRNLIEDLARRDFTVNAMAMGIGGEIIDPFGGRVDLERGVISCVGEAWRRFDEDALRILRALRFASVCGFTIDESVASAMRKKKEALGRVSPERINAELTKLLCGRDAARILRENHDVLGAVLPEILPCAGLTQNHIRHIYDVWTHTCTVVENTPAVPHMRWAALLHDLGKASVKTTDEDGIDHFKGHAIVSAGLVEKIMSRLRFDTKSRDKITTLVRYHDLHLRPERKLVLRWMRKLGADTIEELSQLFCADILGQNPIFAGDADIYRQVGELVRKLVGENACFSLKDLELNGNDVAALGYSGVEIGQALEGLLDAVIEGDVPNEREKLLNYLISEA